MLPVAPRVPVTFKLYAADVGPPICQLLSSSQLSGGFTSVVTAPGTQRADAGPSPPGPSPHRDCPGRAARRETRTFVMMARSNLLFLIYFFINGSNNLELF
jgi:hypothetical protein